MAKSTISMAMFNDKLLVYQRVAKSLHTSPNLTGLAHIFNSMRGSRKFKPFSRPDEPQKCQETTRISNVWNGYRLVICYIAIEMAHLKLIFLLKMVILTIVFGMFTRGYLEETTPQT